MVFFKSIKGQELELTQQEIKKKIFNIRGEQVMIDKDLAIMYQVETKAMNQAVKRNIERFPDSFRFQLTNEEASFIFSRSQFVTLKEKRGQNVKYLPYAFTEQGVAMLSAVLRSEVAVKVSIQIINAFVQMRKLIGQNTIQQLRINNIEEKLIEHDQKFNYLFKALEDNRFPNKGIFYNGQLFDSYSFLANIIRNATKCIYLIDNYIDDSVFTLFTKRKEGVRCVCYTPAINKSLRLDLDKHNNQYPIIEVSEMKTAHDRFLIIDEKELYHIGASLKDLGKKWFGFSRMDSLIGDVLMKLHKR